MDGSEGDPPTWVGRFEMKLGDNSSDLGAACCHRHGGERTRAAPDSLRRRRRQRRRLHEITSPKMCREYTSAPFAKTGCIKGKLNARRHVPK